MRPRGWAGLLLSTTLLLLVGGTRGAEPLEVRLRLEAQPLLGLVEEELGGALVLEARRGMTSPLQAYALLDKPRALGGVEQVPLDLTTSRQARVRIPVALPAGPPRLWSFPLRVFAQGRLCWLADVRLTKAGPWWVIGPFPGNRAESHDRPFPPEQELRWEARYEGKGGRLIAWHPFPASARHENGYHDLNLALGFQENAVAYLYGVCSVPRETPARLLIGSDDSIKVWLNGDLVHDHNLHRGAAPAQDQVAVRLQPGPNRFLLKVVNDDGWWGFFFDVDDGEGHPLPDLRWEVSLARVPLQDPQLRLKEVTRTAARLEWFSEEPEPAKVFVVEAQRERRLVGEPTPKEEMVLPRPGAPLRVLQAPQRTTRHTFTVEGLRPGTRYLLWVEPALQGQRSERLAFFTAPPPGQTQYLRLRILAAIFTNAAQQKDAHRPGAQEPCPSSEIRRLRREIEQALRFYWINSGMRLALKVDYLFDNRFVATPNDNAYGVGFAPGDEERLRELAERAGKRLSDYDGRLFITFEKAWDEGQGRWFYPASGGGTIGPEGEPGMGKSAWRGGSDNSWLFCHEFGHQLDALYHHSLGPEYLFNHFQPWDGTAHRHGEHWDGNAWLLWWWAGYVTRGHQGRPFLPPRQWFRYFTLRWGEVVGTADADEDGIPDKDPCVPLDEERFGSSPRRRDTDGDGLSDLMEAMACSWVEEGLGERWAGEPSRHRCYPRNPDTDGDGLPDGRDPYPLYPLKPEVEMGPPRPFASLKDEQAEATLHLGWDERFLTLKVTAPRPPERVRLMLDADDDGWFKGGDNFLLWVRPAGGLRLGSEWRVNEEGTFAVAFHNCAVPGKWPFFDSTRLAPGQVQFEQRIAEEGYACTVRLPRQPCNGISLRVGERMGILFALRPPGADKDLTAFEPHTFVGFRLRASTFSQTATQRPSRAER